MQRHPHDRNSSDVRDTARMLGASNGLFVASSGSESDRDAVRTVARRRLRQQPAADRHTQQPRGKRRLSTSNDCSASNADPVAVIVLDSDSSSDSDAKPATTATAQPSAVHAQTQQWECTKCTFLNESASTLCEICTSPCPTQKLRNMAQWLAPVAKKPIVRTETAATKRAAPALEVADRTRTREPTAGHHHRGAAVRRGPQSPQRATPILTPAAKTSASALWADAYSPVTVDDLCVNKKKVQELTEWLRQSATPLSSDAPMSVHPRKRLLLLCGPPGCGKSAAARCVAASLRVTLQEWTDSSAAGRLSYDRMLQEQFWTQQTSSVDDFMDFVARAVTYAALPMAVDATHRRRKRRLASSMPSATTTPSPVAQAILIESWPQNWSRADAAWEERVQRVFQRVVDPAATHQFPVICIFSDVRESKVDAKQLAKLFSADVVHSPLTTVLSFNSVTAAQLKKQLACIASAERCSVSAAELQQVVDASGGDIRHAINTLQTVARKGSERSRRVVSAHAPRAAKLPSKQAAAVVGASALRGGADDNVDGNSHTADKRDAFLSDFHVVGKILHGKVGTTSAPGVKGSEPPLPSQSAAATFDRVIEASAMSLDRVLELVHTNCVEYFTEVEELGDALELLSATETMLAESYRGNASSAATKRVRDVAQAMLVRSIALTNDHPAPSAFRPISGAKGFATRLHAASRKDELLRAAADVGSNIQYVCAGDTFAFDVEPFLARLGARDHAALSAGSSNAHEAVRDEVDDEIESSDEGSGGGW